MSIRRAKSNNEYLQWKMTISKENSPSRLYEKDNKHVRRKVAEEGVTDTRFKDKSSAIRHYVHLGIVTEARTKAVNTLNDVVQ